MFEALWENRCYSSGIPDEVPKKLYDSGRAPSYKAIAVAILKNDLKLRSLGFTYNDTSELTESLSREKRQKEGKQLRIF
jgi:predicted phosphoadenosine phosphosulfate sulfurtransferase